jgi:hypothetical protein
MLTGGSITLRPVRDTDIDQLYADHVDIDKTNPPTSQVRRFRWGEITFFGSLRLINSVG